MRKLTLIFALLAIAGCGKTVPVNPPAPTPAPNKDFTVTATFNYDFTNFAACSSAVKTGCISGFSWGYLTGSGSQIPLHTATTAACTGTTQPEACTDVTNSQLPMGSVTFYFVATFINNAGTAGVGSVSNSAPVTVTVGTPTNITVALK